MAPLFANDCCPLLCSLQCSFLFFFRGEREGFPISSVHFPKLIVFFFLPNSGGEDLNLTLAIFRICHCFRRWSLWKMDFLTFKKAFLHTTVKNHIKEHKFWVFRLILFLYIGSFLQNQPDNVLTVFLAMKNAGFNCKGL